MTFNPDTYLNKIIGNVQSEKRAVSAFQEKVFELFCVRPEDTSYNMNTVFLIEGELNLSRAEQCLRQLIDRHEILRTVFVSEEAKIFGRPIAGEQNNFHIHKTQKGLDFAVELARELASRPFDLSNGPLHFVDLIEISESKYLFLLRMSHIIGDLFSMSEYFEQWSQLYRENLMAESAPFSQFIDLERSAAFHDRCRVEREYWERLLSGVSSEIRLPIDKVRPEAAYTSKLDVLTFEFPRLLEERLVRFGRKHQVTMFAVLLASYQILLARISGTREVLTNVPVSKRHEDPRFQHTIGPLLNTVVIRSEIPIEKAFSDVLEETRQAMNEALANSHVVLDGLLSNNVFNYLPLPSLSANPAGKSSPFKATHLGFMGPIPAGPCDLHFCFTGQVESRVLSITYNADIFEKETISLLWSRYLGILEQVLEDSAKPISEITLISEEEKRRVVFDWNSTKTDFPDEGKSLHQLIEERATSHPSAIALEFQGRKWTYQDLVGEANRLAQFLTKRGAAKGSRVAICLPRSEKIIFAMLAVWKLGGVFLSLDPEHPKTRRLQILEDSGAHLLLTLGGSEAAWDNVPWKNRDATIFLDRARSEIENESPEFRGSETCSEDLSYLVYTSGSTGSPKGVLVNHRALKNVLFSVRETLEIDEHDVFVGVASSAFDISLADFFLPLISGSKLVLASRSEQRDPHALQQLLRDATVMSATPMTWRLLLDSGWTGNGRLKAISTGEALPKSLADEIISQTTCLWNLYGPSETTIWSSAKRVSAADEVISIGRPLANTQIYILDESRQPVAAGDVGEIYIGGYGVAVGYVGREVETRERFLSNPFLETAGQRIFRTGDLGRFLKNGDIQFLGRADRQVKIQGYRIELEEVESAIQSHPAVKSCTVVPRRSRENELDSLVSFVVANTALDRSELERYLQTKLPAYMRPAEIFFVGEMPLTSSGKIHHARLWSSTENPTDVLSVLERTTRDVLGLSPERKLDARTGFFDLGLTSFTAVELKRRVCSAFPFLDATNIPNTLVFRYPTLEKLAEFVQGAASHHKAAQKTVKQSRTASQGDAEPIAIVGMACRFPGAANSPKELWRILSEGVDALEEIPKSRFDSSRFDFSSRGGFLSDIERFDAKFFGISPKEARSMDPQQRIVLETCWEALEDAGESAQAIFGSRTAVCIGAMASGYQHQSLESADSYFATGGAPNAISGRVSYFFGFHGPAISLDTGCSSSLVALDSACRYLRTGTSDRALAGGVNVILSPDLSVLLSRTGALSTKGRCATFDADADGYVRSEGCGILVLKRLADAERNGDQILAVIRGTAVNQDGRGISFTAPNGQSQVSVIKDALENANLTADQVDYIEAHGTGTPLGDPIEMQALGEVFANRERPLYVGSIKTNLGHTEAAAGIAGVMKTVLALNYETIPKHLHLRELNPNISLHSDMLCIPREAVAWCRSPDRRRVAGVSSFGISGTNAHVLLEEAPRAPALQNESRVSTNEKPSQVFTLSARTETSLKRLVEKYVQFVDGLEDQDFRDLCANVAIGRSHFEVRLAIVAKDLSELTKGLQDFLFGDTVQTFSTSEISQLAQSYVEGKEVDWRQLFGDYNRMSLPTYVFERQRFWINEEDAKPAIVFEQVLSLGTDSYLSGHVIYGQFVVPVAALIELATRAGLKLLGEVHDIKNLAIDSPLVMSKEVDRVVRVALEKTEAAIGFVIQSSDSHKVNWSDHASGTFASRASSLGKTQEASVDFQRAESVCVKKKDVEKFYQILKDRGFSYSEEYACAEEILYSETQVVARLQFRRPETADHLIHPALLDACLHVGFAPLVDENSSLFMPVGVEEFRFHRKPDGSLRVSVEDVSDLHGAAVGVRVQDVKIYDENGLSLEFRQMASRPITKSSLENSIAKSKNEELSYEIKWKQQNRTKTTVPPETAKPLNWLILADDRGLGEELARLVRHRGGKAQAVHFEKDLRLSSLNLSCDRIVHLWGLNSETVDSLDTDQLELSDELLRTSQSLIYGSGLELAKALQVAGVRGTRLAFVSNRAQAVTSDQASPDFLQSSILGLSRVINHEQPDYRSTVIDLDWKSKSDSSDRKELAEFLYREIAEDDGEREVACRDSQRYVPRLVKSAEQPRQEISPRIRADGSYVITGGLGDLGIKMAQYLVERGAKHLILIGRNPAASVAADQIEKWIKESISVKVVQADVCDASLLESLFQNLRDAGQYPPVKGVFHCAGILADGLLDRQDQESYERVMRVKVQGAWNLWRACREDNLDFFVLFSSISAVLGNTGQANYAAANAQLDGFSHYLRSRGHESVLSINWGPWDDIGWVREKSAQRFLNRRNAHFLSLAQGFRSLDTYLSRRTPAQVICMKMNWPDYIKFLPASFSHSLFSNASFVSTPFRTSEEEKGARLEADTLQFLKSEVAQLLGIEIEAIDIHSSLMDMGFDSLMVVDFRNSLKKAIGGEKGRNLPATIVFNYPTLHSLHEFLLSYLGTREGKSETSNGAKPESKLIDGGEPIAVVGMSCRFPGGANSPEEFWKMLDAGADGIGTIPKSRFDLEKYFSEDASAPGKTYVRHGGFLEGIEEFDAQFFGLSPKEALALDPQQRLMLEVSWEALERQGQSFDKVFDSNTGVFVGVMYQDYADRLSHSRVRDEIEMYIPSGAAASAIAGRLSYFFNFKGPALSLDTACSSSLTALHLACESLRNSTCDRAIAGGVNVILSPVGYTAMSRARAFSYKGRCSTFDAQADGYVRSEGCGVLVLKRLSDAQRDGDQILALIRGTAVNQDGRSISFTAPNGRAQSAVLREALRVSGVNPDEVDYLEAHGTGTPLGDPIEMHAIAEVFRDRESPLVVGSVKTNIGHTESAAGIAGVIKSILSLQHERIPRHLHLKEINPKIEIDSRKIQFPAEPKSWKRNSQRRRIAGVSSFGISGTNAHVLLEEAPLDKSARQGGLPGSSVEPQYDKRQEVFVLSAKTEAAMRAMIRRYIAFLEEEKELSFVDLCASVAVGRAQLEQRFAVFANSIDDLKSKLREAVDLTNKPEIPVSVAVSVSGQLNELVRRYLAGERVEWSKYFGSYNRVRLPTYVFQRQTFWIDGEEFGGTDDVHPLLGKLTRSFENESEYIFEQKFDLASISYLSGHKIFEEAVVPGAAYLEMALAAGRCVCDGPIYIENLSIDAPMILKDWQSRLVQFIVSKDADGIVFKILSRLSPSENGSSNYGGIATVHATGQIRPVSRTEDLHRSDRLDVLSIKQRLPHQTLRSRFYENLANLGFSYSGKYQCVQKVHFSEGEVLSEVELPKTLTEDILHRDDGYMFHPALLDSCLHAGFAAIEAERESLLMPVGVERFISYRKAEGRLWSHMVYRPVTVADRQVGVRTVDVEVWNESGIVAEIRGLTSKDAPANAFQRMKNREDGKDSKSLLHEIQWQKSNWPPGRYATNERWLILSDRYGLGQNLAELVRLNGGSATIVQCDSMSDEIIRNSLHEKPSRIVHLWSLDSAKPKAAQSASWPSRYLGFGSALSLVQIVKQHGLEAQVSFVTSFAQSIGDDHVATNFQQSSVWGFARVLRQEHPELNGLLVDIDFDVDRPADLAETARRILAEVNSDSHDREVVHRSEGRYVPRLEAVDDLRSGAKSAPLVSRPEDSSYLILGGLGGIGFVIAKCLAGQGARHLILVGRSSPTDSVQREIESLQLKGVRVHVRQADVTKAEEVRDLVSWIRQDLTIPHVRGIVHCAGLYHAAPLMQQTQADLERLSDVKLNAALALCDEMGDGRIKDLEFFALFSSTSALLGYPGLASYAAANAELDGLAHDLRSRGVPAFTINWGPWSDIGMVTKLSERHRAALKSDGEFAIAPAEGASAFIEICQSSRIRSQVAAMKMDWKTYLRGLPRSANSEFFSLLAREQIVSNETDLVLSLRKITDEAARKDELISYLKSEASRLIGKDVNEISEAESLISLGMDSLVAVEYRNLIKHAIGGQYGKEIPAVLIFSYPTIQSIADFLFKLLDLGGDRRPTLLAAASKSPSASKLAQKRRELQSNEPIAVVGMSCRFPGGVSSPEDYWKLLIDERDAISEIPKSRFDIESYYDPNPSVLGKTYLRRGGFIENISEFDPEFFGVSAREALALDPQQRLLLEVCWEALERSGAPLNLEEKHSTDVYIGSSSSDFMERLLSSKSRGQIEDYIPTGATPSVMVGRLSYFFNLKGTAIPIDTACASALSALHLACESLRQGSCERAIAGGVNIILSPMGYLPMSRLRTLSAAGRCATFDFKADGYVRSEGCGVLVLKRLSDAQRDRDQILALVRGTAVNQDGRSVSMTAPNRQTQIDVMQDALRAAGLSPNDIGYVEAHGTGTPLGDAIELQSIAEVFGGRSTPLVVASGKTNIGHTEAASGIAGVIKTILSLQNECIPRHLHFERLNQDCDIDSELIQIPESVLEWRRQPGRRRFAGVSAFGISGTNAHVIIEEAPDLAPLSSVESTESEIFVLSARSDSALRELARRYLEALPEASGISLKDVCANACVGRSHFECRLAVVAGSAEDLRAKLVSFLNQKQVSDVFHGTANKILPAALDVSREGANVQQLRRLAQQYVSGAQLDWAQFFGSYRKVVLPTYAFQRKKFWLEELQE